jgi:sortase A
MPLQDDLTRKMNKQKISDFRNRARNWLRQPSVHRAAIDDVRAALLERDVKRLRKPAEYCLWIVAILTLGYCTAQYSAAAIHQSRQNSLLDVMRHQRATLPGDADPSPEAASLRPVLAADLPLGRIEIPRIGVSSIVEEGDADGILRVAVGHVPGTTLPGAPGNAALAAHRDTYFRHLEDVQAGDEIWFTTLTTIYKYRVKSTSIVEPSDLAVLAATNHPQLTLITCYPFHYFGPAPKRFIVVAFPE